MLGMLIAYDAEDNIVGTLEQLVAYDDAGNAIGLYDFDAYREAGGDLLGFARVQGAVGADSWPEWVSAGDDFRVVLGGPQSEKRIKALVHKNSGHRRERADIEAAIAERLNERKAEAKRKGDERRASFRERGMPENLVELIPDPGPSPADIRDLVGGPDRPLRLDENGRNKPKPTKKASSLPIMPARSQRPHP